MTEISTTRLSRYQKDLENAAFRGTTEKIPYLKLAAGKSVKIRILPGEDPEDLSKDFFVKGINHYNMNPEKPQIPVVSPRTLDSNAYCPMYEAYLALKKSSSKTDNDMAIKLRPNTRYYMNVYVKSGENAGKVMVYAAPKQVWEAAITHISNPDYGDITDPEKGFDFNLTRTGSDMNNTSYSLVAVPSPRPIASDEDELNEILAQRYDLSKFRQPPSVAEIKKFMNGELDFFTTGGFAQKKENTSSVSNTNDDEEDDVPSTPIVEEEAPVVVKKKGVSLADLKARIKSNE